MSLIPNVIYLEWREQGTEPLALDSLEKEKSKEGYGGAGGLSGALVLLSLFLLLLLILGSLQCF